MKRLGLEDGRRRGPRRASSTTTRPRRSTGSSASSPGSSDRRDGPGGRSRRSSSSRPGLRAWAALEVPVPWIAPDEMVYALLGRGLWEHGSLDILGGPTPYYSLLTPLFAGLPARRVRPRLRLRRAAGAAGAGDVAGGGAGVPLGAVARVRRGRRCVAAALAVAVPGLAYSGLVMTEVLFYPLLVLAAWAAAEALVRRDVAGAAARGRGVPRGRGRRGCRRSCCCPRMQRRSGWTRDGAVVGRAAEALAGGRRASAAWRSPGSSGSWRPAAPTLGGYQVVADASYSVGGAAKYVVYHLADLLILCGVVPASASRAARPGAAPRRARPARARVPRDRRRRSRSGSCSRSAIFASQYSDRLVERNLIGARAGAVRRARALARARSPRRLRACAAGWPPRCCSCSAGQAAGNVFTHARRDDDDPALPARAVDVGRDDADRLPGRRRAARRRVRVRAAAAAAVRCRSCSSSAGSSPRSSQAGSSSTRLRPSSGCSSATTRRGSTTRAGQAVPLPLRRRAVLARACGRPSSGTTTSTVSTTSARRCRAPCRRRPRRSATTGRLHFARGRAPKFAIASTWIELDGERKGQVAQQGLTQAGPRSLASGGCAPPALADERAAGERRHLRAGQGPNRRVRLRRLLPVLALDQGRRGGRHLPRREAREASRPEGR